MPSWDDYRFFLALEREASVVKAARKLQVDVTTVRRRLASLEEALGARLLERRRQGVVLTRAGERLVKYAVALESTTREIERDLGGEDERLQGTVRFSAGEAFTTRLVAPALGTFRARCPEIRVELLVDNYPVDLVRGEADVVLRLVRPSDEALVARRIATLEFGLYAASSYLDRAGRPGTEADLARHAFVGYGGPLERTPETQWLLGRGLTFAIRTNSPVAILSAAAAGNGIAAVAALFAAQHRELERVLPGTRLPAREVWLATHRDLQRAARIRAFQEFVAGLFDEPTRRSMTLR